MFHWKAIPKIYLWEWATGAPRVAVRLVATLVSLVEDLLMLPVTLAVSFGSVATLLLFFRCTGTPWGCSSEPKGGCKFHPEVFWMFSMVIGCARGPISQLIEAILITIHIHSIS